MVYNYIFRKIVLYNIFTTDCRNHYHTFFQLSTFIFKKYSLKFAYNTGAYVFSIVFIFTNRQSLIIPMFQNGKI